MDEYKSEQIIEDQAATIRQLTMMLSTANDSLSMKNSVISGLEYTNENLEKEKESLRVQLVNSENKASCGDVHVCEALRDLEVIVEYVRQGNGSVKIVLSKVLRDLTGIRLSEAKDAIEGGDFYFNKPQTLGDIFEQAPKDK